jgi:AcrR family transcriptional regulator
MNQLLNSPDEVPPDGVTAKAGRTGRVARRRTETRARLLAAAERAFARHGFPDARIEQIAEDADVSVGSIYNHFGSKEQLFVAVAEHTVAGVVDYMARAYTISDSPLEQVIAAGDAYMRFHLDHPVVSRYLTFDSGELEDDGVAREIRERLGDQIEAMLEALETTIAAAVASGEARELDPRMMARFLFAAWNGVAALGLRSDDFSLTPAEIEACLRQARRVLAEGLTHPDNRNAEGGTRVRILDTAKEP